jgi:hypothetical protein
MDETYRMLGREHEADLERDAAKWRRAAELPGHKRGAPVAAPNIDQERRPGRVRCARIFAFLIRVARAEG